MRTRPDDPILNAKEAQVIDQICDRFEAAWGKALSTNGPSPAIEDYLHETPDALRRALFSELLSLELQIRKQANHTITWEEYQRRFPDAQDALAWFLEGIDPALAPTEDFAGASTVSMNLDVSPETVDKFPLNGETARPSTMSEPSHPKRMGRYQVLRVLGEGNFGCVYLAEDEKLGRQVAVKIPRLNESQNAQQKLAMWLALFEAEAKKVASLEHAGIVPVYDIGQLEDGRPFIVSRYVSGGDLAARMESGPLDFGEAARMIEQLALALHQAHLRKLVHRDIKPHNVLLENGQPFVADFGLALHDTERRMHRGHIAGSPAYMSPEQVGGEMHRLDGRSDIWSLGVMLYEMLTGERPFSGTNATELFDTIQHDHVKPPRQKNDAIPAELERIVLKCLEKDPNDRYSTAKDLAHDLKRWRHDKGGSRFKMLAAAGGVGLVALLAFVLFRPERMESGLVPAPVVEPLKASLSITRVTQPGGKDEPIIESDQDSPVPFRVAEGDMIQFAAELNRPAYLYMLWIDSEGRVVPLHPWVLQWESPPDTEEPRSKIISPADSKGWEFGGPPGGETLVLLAREKPLPDDFDLQTALPKFSVLEVPGLLRTRGPKSPIPRNIPTVDDSERREQLKDKLKSHFPLIEIKSFVNLGEISPED